MSIESVENFEHRSGFAKIGYLNAAQAAPGVTARDAASVEALGAGSVVIWEVPNAGANIHLRFETDADADAHVVNLMGMWGDDDDYVPFATLTLTGGTQTVRGGSRVWVDTVVVSNEYFEGALTVIASAQNSICRVIFDGFNLTKIAFHATSLEAGSTLRVEGEVVN